MTHDPMPPRSDRELATARVVEASPARVFEAFRDPVQLARWWGPTGFTNTFHDFDFRAGGAWRFTMHGPDGHDYPNESVFEDLLEPSRVVIRHVSKPQFTAEFGFDPVPGGTRVVFRQVFDSREVCE